MASLLSLPAHYQALVDNPYDPALYSDVAQPGSDDDLAIEKTIPVAGYIQASHLLREPGALPARQIRGLGPAVAAEQIATTPAEDNLFLELATSESPAGEAIPKEELARRASYMEVLRARVPGVDAMTAYQLAVSDVPIDQAVQQARAVSEAQPKSFFSKVFSPIGGALKSVFIDAPNWLWQHTTVDLMQEIAELGGAPSEIAQRLSPGQALVGLLPGDLGAQRDGEWLDPKDWHGAARWASGGLDIVFALAADPTNVLMNFRAFRALPLGMERAFGVTRGTRGGLVPTPLLRGSEALVTFDPARAGRIAEELLEGKNVFRNFVAGHVKLTELVSFVRGHGPFDEAARWIAESSKDSILQGQAKILRRFHSKGMDLNAVASLAALGHIGGHEAVKDGVVAMLSGQVPERLSKLVDVHAQRYVALKAELVRAANQAQLMEKGRTGYGRPFGTRSDLPGQNPEFAAQPYIVDPKRNLPLEPSMNMPYSAKFIIAENPQMASALDTRLPSAFESTATGPRTPFDPIVDEIETGIPAGDRPGATRPVTETELAPSVTEELELGIPGPRDQLMPMPPEPGIRGVEAQLVADELDLPAEYMQTVRGGLGPQIAAERKKIEALGEMFPNLKELLHGVSTEAEARALVDVARQLSPIGLLDDLPRTLLSDSQRKFYDGLVTSARSVRVIRAFDFDMQAKPDVSFHDPMAHEQIRRLSVDFGFDPTEQEEWIQKWLAAAKDEKSARTVAKELRDTGYAKLLSVHPKLAALDPEEVIQRLEDNVVRQRDEIYSAAPGVPKDRILFESQYENMIELADPRVIRTLKRSIPRWLALNPNPTLQSLHRHITGVMDEINNFMKRLWVARPATGLRVALENQTRALLSGMYSAWSSPHTWAAIVLSPYSKKAARTLEGRVKHLSQVAIDTGDLGLIRAMRYAGLMRQQEVHGAYKIFKWDEVKDNAAMSGWYREAQAGRINDFMLNDRLAQQIISGGRIVGPGGVPRGRRADALDWLLSPDASEYRKRMRINDIATANRRVREMMSDMRDMGILDPRLSTIARSGKVQAGDIAEFGLEAPRLPSGDIYRQPPMTNKGLMDKIVGRFLSSPDELGRRKVAQAEMLKEISVAMARFDAVQAARKARRPKGTVMPDFRELENPEDLHQTLQIIGRRHPGKPGEIVSAEDIVKEPGGPAQMRSRTYVMRDENGRVVANLDVSFFGVEGVEELPAVDILVHPEARGKGYATKILRHAARDLNYPLDEETIKQLIGAQSFSEHGANLAEAILDRGFNAARSLDGDFIKQLIAGARPPRAGKELEYALYENAYRKAVERTRLLFYDLSENSRFADMARFIAPFGNAYQEMVTRWTRIVADRPWIPHVVARAFDASGDIPGLTTKDPQTGETIFFIPFANHLMSFAGLQRHNPITGEKEGVGVPLWGRLQGINMVTGNGGLPGFGPYLQMPASWIADNTPQLDDMWRHLFPYGQQVHFSDVMPGWMRSLFAVTRAPDSDFRFGNIVKEYVGAEMAAMIARGEDMKNLDVDKLISAARTTFAIRAFSQAVLPTSVNVETPFHKEAEFYRWARNIDEDLADQMFVARYGSSIFAAVEQMTRTENSRALPPTEGIDNFIRHPSHRALFDQFGKVGLDVLAEQWEGDFDPVEFHRQINNGDRVPIKLNEFINSAGASVAWKRWSMVSNSINRAMRNAGIAPRTKAAKPYEMVKEQIRTNLGLAFPSWAREYSETRGGLARRAENIAQLARLATMQELAPLESVQFLRKYFALRSFTIDLLEAHGISTIDSQKGLSIGRWWDDQVLTLLRGHPSASRLYGKYLAKDQLEPLAQLIFASGLKGHAASLGDLLTQQGAA